MAVRQSFWIYSESHSTCISTPLATSIVSTFIKSNWTVAAKSSCTCKTWNLPLSGQFGAEPKIASPALAAHWVLVICQYSLNFNLQCLRNHPPHVYLKIIVRKPFGFDWKIPWCVSVPHRVLALCKLLLNSIEWWLRNLCTCKSANRCRTDREPAGRPEIGWSHKLTVSLKKCLDFCRCQVRM